LDLKEGTHMLPLEKPGSPQDLTYAAIVNDVVEDILEHHGIKGQKWGVRKKEDTAESSSSKPDTLVTKEGRHLTPTQKKILIGAGVAAGILAAYGAYKLIDSGSANQILTKSSPFKSKPSLSGPKDVDSILREVVAPINPGYGGLGTKNNCKRATFAYELRRRGMDVKATKSIGGTGQGLSGLVNATTPGSHLPTGKLGQNLEIVRETARGGGPLTKRITSGNTRGELNILNDTHMNLMPQAKAAYILDSMSRIPDGARGEMSVRWAFGAGHSMAWEMIGGKPHIFDAQAGKEVSFDVLTRMAPHISEAALTRLDDIPLNMEFLKRWAVNAS
jgi:hypothetical protein